MSSLGTALTAAQSALSVNQSLIGITGDNIANLDNSDYARRQATVEEMPPLQLGQFTIGTGVKLGQITSMRDAVLNLRIAAESSDIAKSSHFVDGMTQVANLFPADGSSGLSAALDSFWASWQGLSSDPSSSGAREQVFAASQSLASAFRNSSSALAATTFSTAQNLSQEVTKANDLLGRIADLNGSAASDTPMLRDQQDEMIGSLAKIMDISVLRNGGLLQITSSSGALLVSGISHKSLQSNVTNGVYGISANGYDITSDIGRGSIGGELQLLNQALPGLQSRLDTLSTGVAAAVNGAYGHPFFSGTGAASMQLAVPDSSQIQSGASNLAGDNSIALAVADLRTSNVVSGQTASQYHAESAFQVGEQISYATAQRDAAQQMLDSMNKQRQSVEGVSIDQEAANLMQYQRAYSAAARILTAIDEMLRTAMTIGASTTG